GRARKGRMPLLFLVSWSRSSMEAAAGPWQARWNHWLGGMGYFCQPLRAGAGSLSTLAMPQSIEVQAAVNLDGLTGHVGVGDHHQHRLCDLVGEPQASQGN